jgi:hypothetical protein
MSAPLPTPVEAASLTGTPLRGVAPCVEVRGPLRFRTGLAHLYEPPHTELVVSPAHVMLSITRFADEDIWKNMFEYVTSYLGDALTLSESDDPNGHREYQGQGAIVTLGFRRPNVRIDSRDLVIELGIRRDEPAAAALRHLLGVAPDAALTSPDDGNWRELATRWPLHLECSRHGATARFRFSAPHHTGETSTASLCEQWAWSWLELCAGTGAGHHHDRNQLSWDLAGRGHASIVRGDGTGRRDVHELHVPVSWLSS